MNTLRLKNMKKIILLIMLLCIGFVSAETISDGLFTINTMPVQGAETVSDANYQVYAMVTDMAGITQDTNNIVCVGLMCQFFPEEEAAPPGVGGGISGGGGNILPEQKNIVDINISLNQCIKDGGTPVNIKGGLFCHKQDLYYPISAVKGWNLGEMLIKGNPTLGWMILTLVIAGFILFVVEEKYVVDRRDMRLLKKYKRQQREGSSEEQEDEELLSGEEQEEERY